MNAFEFNKIIGAVLGILLLVMGVGFLAETIYAPKEGRGQGYALPEPGVEAHGEETVEVEVVPLETLLASASAENGARVSRKCQACHNFDEGGSNKVGPGLYDIVGTAIAENDSFAYSDTLVQMGGEGNTWTYAALNEFLISPKTFAPGTKMSFAGLSKDQDRVDMLAYLQSLSASPVPFPAMNDAEAMGEEAQSQVEEAAHEETAPASHGTAPATQDATPVAEEPAPVTEEAEATTQESAPAAVEETAPATEEVAPVSEEAATEPAAAVTEETAAAENSGGETSELAAFFANADATEGARVFRKCKACHNADEGAGNKVGPVLYDIVGKTIGANPDFNYSDILVSMGAEGGTWTYENLNAFLTKPRDFADGTKMSFSGLRKDEDRANLLAYLQSLSANPVAFPQ